MAGAKSIMKVVASGTISAGALSQSKVRPLPKPSQAAANKPAQVLLAKAMYAVWWASAKRPLPKVCVTTMPKPMAKTRNKTNRVSKTCWVRPKVPAAASDV